MEELLLDHAPYSGVRVSRQWRADTFGVDIEEDGMVTATSIRDDQLEIATSTVSEFDERGAISSKSDFSGSVETAHESYEYDADGRIVTHATEFIADELSEVETREYDDQGRPTRYTTTYDDGSTRTTTFTYDDTEQSVTRVTISPDGVEEHEWTRRDPDGRIIERKRSDPESDQDTHTYYEYDASGKIGTAGIVLPSGDRHMTERYTYDADREALWERFDDDGELIERRTTEYENGRIVRETLEDTHSDDVITTYEYDDDGNEIHISTTAGTFIRETFKLYDAEGRLSVAAMGDVVEEYRSPNSRFGGGIEYYRNASTTWFEYE